MKYLVDAQLPPALARFLTANGEEVVHVLDVEMLESWILQCAKRW